MRYVVDIFQRFQSAYGFVGANLQGLANRAAFSAGIAYNDSKYQRQSNDKDYKDMALYTVADHQFADITFRHDGKELVFSLGSLLGDTEGVIAPPPMVSFRRGKNITETTIDEGGNDSEIVEFFSLQNFEIDIKGILVDMDNHHYPQAKVKELISWFNINDVLEVVCPIFQYMGIHSLYFKELSSFEPVEAFPDTVKFAIQAKSITPAEVTLLDG